MNMKNDLKEEPNRRMRLGSTRNRQGSYRPTDGPRSPCPSVLLDSFQRSVTQRRRVQTPLPRGYSLPTEPLRDRALERCLLKVNRRTQHLADLRTFDLAAMSRLRDPAEYISKAKHR
ncbi:hypothetical protein RB195_026340 [Necator americanus]|uniref:Uncharacterized protein n=1 Tax=Necator americanus TaxID=51031 RepID=A0ABR1EYV5_NECAM